MIRVSVLYPNSPGATFDMPYYIDSHMLTLVKGKLGAALKRIEIDHGLGGGMPGVPAPDIAALAAMIAEGAFEGLGDS